MMVSAGKVADLHGVGMLSSLGEFSIMRTQKGHNVPFLESVSLKKRKRKAMERIKQIADMFIKVIVIYMEKMKKKNHAICSLRW